MGYRIPDPSEAAPPPKLHARPLEAFSWEVWQAAALVNGAIALRNAVGEQWCGLSAEDADNDAGHLLALASKTLAEIGNSLMTAQEAEDNPSVPELEPFTKGQSRGAQS